MKLKPGKPPMLSKADLLSITGPSVVIETKHDQTPTLKLSDNKMAVTKSFDSSSTLGVTNTKNHINIMCLPKDQQQHQTLENQVMNVDINDNIDFSRMTISSETTTENVLSLHYVNELVQGIETLDLSNRCDSNKSRNSGQNNEYETINIVEELNIKPEEYVDVVKNVRVVKQINIEETEVGEVVRDEDKSVRVSIGSEEDVEVKEEGAEEKEQAIPQEPKDVMSVIKEGTLCARSPMKVNDGARGQRISHMRPYKSCSRSHQCGGTTVVSEPDLSDSTESTESPNQLLLPNIDLNYTNFSPESNIGPDSPEYGYSQASISPIQGEYAVPPELSINQMDHSPPQAEITGNFVPSPAMSNSEMGSLYDMLQEAIDDPLFMKTYKEELIQNLNVDCTPETGDVPQQLDYIPEPVRQHSNDYSSPVPQSPPGRSSPRPRVGSSLSAKLKVIYRNPPSSNSNSSSSSSGTISSPFSSPSFSPESCNQQNIFNDPFDIILDSSPEDLSPRAQEIKEDLEISLGTHQKCDTINGPQLFLDTSNTSVSPGLASNVGIEVTYLPISPGYSQGVPEQSNVINFSEMQIVPDMRQAPVLKQNPQPLTQQSVTQPTQAPNVFVDPNRLPFMTPNLQDQQRNVYSLPAIIVPPTNNSLQPPSPTNLGSVQAPNNPSNLALVTNPILLTDGPSQSLPSNGGTNNIIYVVQIPTTRRELRAIVPSPVLPLTTMESGRERLLARCSKQKKEAAWVRLSELSDQELMSGEEIDGDTQLMILVSHGASKEHPEMLYTIVERLKKIPGGLTAVNNHQMSALYHACYHNESLAARYLAETMAQLNINLDQESKDGNGLLHMLCRMGDSHMQVLAELLSVKNANGEPVFNINRHNHSEGTPLHVAVDTHGVGGINCINTVHLLLNMGANILEQERRGGNTALHCAAMQSCCPRLVYTLLKPEGLPGRGTGVVNSTNYTRNTPLHLVCPRSDIPRERQREVVKLLVDYGAVSSRLNHNGKPPLALVMPDRKEAIRSLFRR